MSNIEEYGEISNTHNMIQRWDAPVAEVKDKDIIVFIGRTQAGKSTIHNLVTGGKLKIAHNNKADPNRANIILGNNEDNDKRAVIGVGYRSETSLPNIYEYQGQTYVDCPGFGDARGFVESVSNGLGIQKLLKSAKSVRLIAVAAEIDYQDRRPPLARHVYWVKRLFIDLADFIVNLDDISKISFIISKASPDITKTDILKSTKSIMDSYIKQKSFLFSYDGTEHMPIDNDYQYARQKKTLELLCSQDINMAFFHKPTNDKLEKEDEDRKSIINLIEKTEKLSSREVHACSLVGKGLNIEYFTSGLITPTQAANLFKGSHISSIGRKNINQIIQAISNKREYMDEIMRCADLDVCKGLLGNHSNITAETQASILPSIQHVDPNYLSEIAKWVMKYRNIEEFCEFLDKYKVTKEALSYIMPLLLGNHSNITAETQASILPSIPHVDPNYLPEIAKWVMKYRNIEEFCEFLDKYKVTKEPLLLGNHENITAETQASILSSIQHVDPSYLPEITKWVMKYRNIEEFCEFLDKYKVTKETLSYIMPLLLGNHSNITAETQASILPNIQHVDPNYLPEIAKWVMKYRNIEEFCEFLDKYKVTKEALSYIMPLLLGNHSNITAETQASILPSIQHVDPNYLPEIAKWVMKYRITKEALSYIMPLLLGDEQKEYLEEWYSKADIEKLYSTIGKDNFILVLKKLYELEKNPNTHQLYSNRLINWVTWMSNDMIDEVKNSTLLNHPDDDDMRLCFYMLKHKHVNPDDVEHCDVECSNKGHFQYKSLINIVNHFRDRNLHYVTQKLDSEYYVPVDLADLNNRTILEIYKYAAKSNRLSFRLEGALYDHEVEFCNPNNPDMKDVKAFSDEQLRFLAENIADDELYLLAYYAPIRIMRKGCLSDKQIEYLASNVLDQFHLFNLFDAVYFEAKEEDKKLFVESLTNKQIAMLSAYNLPSEAWSYIKTHSNKKQPSMLSSVVSFFKGAGINKTLQSTPKSPKEDSNDKASSTNSESTNKDNNEEQSDKSSDPQYISKKNSTFVSQKIEEGQSNTSLFQ